MPRLRAPLLVALLLAGCAAPAAPDETAVAFPAVRVETGMGAFTAILFCEETPATCAFFRDLVESKYYDGRAFGRVIPGFVIQEVDRTGGTTDHEGRVVGEFGSQVMFSAGAFGIARGADPDSGGSEFFVMDFATSHLYGNYTAFAQVVEGMDVVRAIARVPAVRTGPASAVGAPEGAPVAFGVHDRVPVDPVEMTRVTMTTLELPASVAARYPLVVGESVRTDAYRVTLEWPRDLRAGAASELTWYVMPRDATPTGSLRDPEPVELAGARVLVEGPSSFEAPLAEEGTRGVLAWRWTPAAPGEHYVRLFRGGEELAGVAVAVR
ncbi:MAG TPA: peptidylprolyl isomerase [Candidatus Thermoplasmatota archaeon]|nr:peptidylprolyl isomerase [Candidatus Thermoplasmatota archaeon]